MNGEKSRTKRKGKILKVLSKLRDLVDDPDEIKAVEELAQFLLRDFEAPSGAPIKPIIEIVDDIHQKFNGVIYTFKDDVGYYQANVHLHRLVWIVGAQQEIPEDCIIHHKDNDPSNNDISNLQLMTKSEHMTLHNTEASWLKYYQEFTPHNSQQLQTHVGDYPKVEVIDEDHQKFLGFVFRKSKDDHFVCTIFLHRLIWTYFNGEIPDGYAVHHINFDKTDNRIENLQLLTFTEHSQLHRENDKLKEFVCANCGCSYTTRDVGKNKFCSHRCAHDFYKKNGTYNEQRICPVCGTTFEIDRHSERKTCSWECTLKLRARTTAQRKIKSVGE